MMNKILRYFFISLLALVTVLLLLVIICFKPVDMAPYKQTDFYQKELDEISKIPKLKFPNSEAINNTDSASALPLSTSTLQIGWSRVNLLPPFSTPIAIDAHRGGKHFEGVHDSIYVRAFVFKQGEKKIAYVSADLLIIPPTVSEMFDTLMRQQGFDSKNIYFTATHTHTSIGAWHNSYVGEIFAGKYDAHVPIHIANCIAKAIRQADENCSPAKLGYAEIPTTKLVFNRLVHEKGKVDSLLRIVKIEKENGEKAAIITFAAHCTVFHEKMMQLTGDWGGIMMHQLDTSGKINFASFSAGSVGSHGPYEISKNQEEESNYLANHVAALVLANFDSIPVTDVAGINMLHVPLYLRDPEMRVMQHVALRPWLFTKLFGDERVYINTLQLGNIYFAGMPCDFSGELDSPLDSIAHKQHLHLLITSFNGGYMGYVTDTRWYEMNAYETRTMGWFGPYNGDYLTEVISRLIDKTAEVR
jgi:neutral ceramidase